MKKPNEKDVENLKKVSGGENEEVDVDFSIGDESLLKCTYCSWTGYENELFQDDSTGERVCPKCHFPVMPY